MSSDRDRTQSPRGASPLARAKEWFLLNGNRGVVAAITTCGVFAAVVAVGVWQATPLQNQQPVFYVFSGMISGNLTIITVVVSINQLLLGTEISTPNEIYTQIEGVTEFREDVEGAAGQIAPVEPMGFLQLLIESARQAAQRLGGELFDGGSLGETDDIAEVVKNVTEHADSVDELLEEGNTSTFTVLSTTLTTNYARDINKLRRVQNRAGNDLPAHVDEAIDDLIEQLQYIDVARQYFKGVYLEQELAALSRYLFYAGIPSLVIVAGALFSLTGGSATSIPRLAPILFSGAITAGFVPLIVLFAFIVRAATVARRTVAVVPFTAPVQEK